MGSYVCFASARRVGKCLRMCDSAAATHTQCHVCSLVFPGTLGERACAHAYSAGHICVRFASARRAGTCLHKCSGPGTHCVFACPGLSLGERACAHAHAAVNRCVGFRVASARRAGMCLLTCSGGTHSLSVSASARGAGFGKAACAHAHASGHTCVCFSFTQRAGMRAGLCSRTRSGTCLVPALL